MCDKKHYDDLENRVTDLESEVAELRSETRTGFSSVNANINLLSQQIANMDLRLIEREKWGELFRSIVKWSVRAVLVIVTYAAGVNLTKDLIPGFFN